MADVDQGPVRLELLRQRLDDAAVEVAGIGVVAGDLRGPHAEDPELVVAHLAAAVGLAVGVVEIVEHRLDGVDAGREVVLLGQLSADLVEGVGADLLGDRFEGVEPGLLGVPVVALGVVDAVRFQDLESDAHRVSLGLGEDRTGVLVNRVDHGAPADGALRPGDVLVAIDGVAVANDMTVERPGIGRVYLSEVFQSKQLGDTLDLSVLRGGKPAAHRIVLGPHQFLVPCRRTGLEPQYLVFGGIVFQPVTFEYLTALEDIPWDLANHAQNYNVVTEDKSQVIIIQKILPHLANRGYEDYDNSVVETVDGVVPRDMQHLVEIIDDAEGPWLRVVTEDRYVLTLNLEQARAAQSAILTGYGISRDRSRDLLSSEEISARVR